MRLTKHQYYCSLPLSLETRNVISTGKIISRLFSTSNVFLHRHKQPKGRSNNNIYHFMNYYSLCNFISVLCVSYAPLLRSNISVEMPLCCRNNAFDGP